MYLKKAKNSKTGRTHLSIAHNYRDEKGKNRTRAIQSIGYLDVLEKDYDDFIAHFKALDGEIEAERVASEGKITFTKSKARKISMRETTRKNLGYLATMSWASPVSCSIDNASTVLSTLRIKLCSSACSPVPLILPQKEITTSI